jgi:hypothetical protein
MPSRQEVIGLYRSLLRSSRNIYDYNFRSHAIRKVKTDFRSSRNISSQVKFTLNLFHI